MKAKSEMAPHIAPVDDDRAGTIAYPRSAERRAGIAKAQAEIAAGRGMTANDACFGATRASCRTSSGSRAGAGGSV